MRMRRQRKVYLTIEFLFVKGNGTNDPIRLVTHKNDIDQPLLTLLQTHVGENLKQVSKRGKSKANPKNSTDTLEWLKQLVFPDPPDQLESFAPPLCLIRSTKLSTPPLQRTSLKRFEPRSYHSLDPFQKLSQSLRQKEFTEFPLIEVWEKDVFIDSGFTETDQDGVWHEKGAEDVDERPRKRRKVEVMGRKRGEAVVKGLLGGYGSSEDEGEGSGDQGSPKALDGLGQYEESEDEGERELEVPNPDTMDGSESSGSDDEVADPAVLIEQLKSAGFAFDSTALDDEELDWGEHDPY